MTKLHDRQLVPLDEKGRAVILFTFECQGKGLGLSGYSMMDRIIAPKALGKWDIQGKGWWPRALTEEELERIPEHWAGRVLLWDRREKRHDGWHIPCYDTVSRAIIWIPMSSRLGDKYATAVQFIDPKIKINPPPLGRAADRNWNHPIPTRS